MDILWLLEWLNDHNNYIFWLRDYINIIIWMNLTINNKYITYKRILILCNNKSII